MKIFIIIALALVSFCAFAQQNSPEVLALQAKIMQETNNNLQCMTQTITLQQQTSKLTDDLAKAQARIKELENK